MSSRSIGSVQLQVLQRQTDYVSGRLSGARRGRGESRRVLSSWLADHSLYSLDPHQLTCSVLLGLKYYTVDRSDHSQPSSDLMEQVNPT